MEDNEKPVLFKTLKQHNVVIVKQPFKVRELYATGNKKGKLKRNRQAQYCENLESIFIDEQKLIEDKPTITPIYIRKTKLLVEPEDLNLLSAMRNHEDNVANGGILFKEVNASQDEIDAIKLYQALDKVRSYVMNCKDEEAKAMGLFFIGHSTLNTSASALKLRLRDKVESEIDTRNKIIKFSEESNKKEKLITTVALIEQEIYLEGKTFFWTNGNEKVYVAEQQIDAINSFSNWLVNDEKGREIYASLLDRLGKKLSEK